ncbi:TPA: hypothetical protein ACUKDC_000678, partial [Escherichia coli]
NVKKRPKGAFLLSAILKDSNLLQVRVERSETTEPLAATARRASEACHPARPTNVKKRPKGAFLLFRYPQFHFVNLMTSSELTVQATLRRWN